MQKIKLGKRKFDTSQLVMPPITLEEIFGKQTWSRILAGEKPNGSGDWRIEKTCGKFATGFQDTTYDRAVVVSPKHHLGCIRPHALHVTLLQ